MSTLCASSRPATDEAVAQKDAIDIEDFIRLYYGEVGVDDFVDLYKGRQDLKRVASHIASAADVGFQNRSSSCAALPALTLPSQARSRAMTFQDDDVRPNPIICVRMILINFEFKSGFFSKDISTASSPRRRSFDSDLREQLSQLAVDFRLNVSRRSEKLSKPLPAPPPHVPNRQLFIGRIDDASSRSLSREARVAPSGELQPDLNHITGPESSSSGSSPDEPVITKEGVEAVEEANLPINHTIDPVRDLILPVVPSGLTHLEGTEMSTSGRSVDDHDSHPHDASDRVEVEEKQATQFDEAGKNDPLGLFERTKATFFSTYAPKVDAPLILPSAPTDEEKQGYLHTNRLPLYAVGVFSFLSLTAGMWLFVISSEYFAWFGVFCGLLQMYLFISYAVGLIGKDFDFENHKKVVAENPIVPVTCPTVDIYLPCCREPLEILKNTYEHVRKLKYPEGKLKIYVLDDGAMESVKQLATSYGFEYMCRDDRPRLKKAGNLRWAFARTYGDFFNIYDADFCPRSDFLLELLPMMLADEKVAIVQSPQFFRTLDTQTWVEQGAGAVQELFYRVVQVNRDRWGASICVGSNAVYRRAALVEVGGTAEIGFSEDVHTGFGCVDRGWKLKYNPLCLACGVCPNTPRAFFSQQMRWCMGSTTLLSNPEFWRSNLTVGQKICYLCGMMYYSAVSLSIFVNPLPGIFLLWIRPEYFKYYNLAFAVPSLLYTLVTFRLWARASFSINVQFIMVIQAYAYFTAIKDRIFGRALAWAPSGDSKAHKNNKYRNMRIMAWCWLFTWQGALVAGITYRIIGGMPWWNTIPLLALDTFNFFLAHRFLFCQ